ncbi:MAG: DedA family protein [Acidobacteria bacterium]|nr:DedA family protein [Acidobacteriota bacterium]
MSSPTAIFASHGAIFITSALEFLGLPIPGGIVIAIFAAQSSVGQHDLVSLVLAASLGATAGDIPWYWFGRVGDKQLLHWYCRFTLGSGTCVLHTESFFHRFGSFALVISKFMPGVRLFAPPMAGMTGYSFIRFLLLDWLGGVVWAGCFALAGRTFGQDVFLNMSDLEAWALSIAPMVVIIIVRLFKRAMRGPAEEVLLSSPRPGTSAPTQPPVKEPLV